MVSTEWGLFRLKGALSRKTFKARPVGPDQWAVTERTVTAKTVRGLEGDTCLTSSFVPADQFLDHYVAVDTVAREMVKAPEQSVQSNNASQGPTVLR
jgi:hypothetical protein